MAPAANRSPAPVVSSTVPSDQASTPRALFAVEEDRALRPERHRHDQAETLQGVQRPCQVGRTRKAPRLLLVGKEQVDACLDEIAQCLAVPLDEEWVREAEGDEAS